MNVKKWLMTMAVSLLGLGILCLAGCGSNAKDSSEEAANEAPVAFAVEIDGVEMTTGVTTVQELVDLGYMVTEFSPTKMVQDGDDFYFEYQGPYDMALETDANTVYAANSIVMDGERVASISVLNETEGKLPLGECTVSNFTFYASDPAVAAAKIEGMDFSEITPETLTEALGEADYISDSKDEYNWYRTPYSLSLSYDENNELVLRISYN